MELIGTATSTDAYCATSIPVPFSVMDLVPVGMIYSEGIALTLTIRKPDAIGDEYVSSQPEIS